jgi:hypothetical protein
MLIVGILYDCNTLYYSKVVVITHIHYKIQIQCLNKQYKIGIYSILTPDSRGSQEYRFP